MFDGDFQHLSARLKRDEGKLLDFGRNQQGLPRRETMGIHSLHRGCSAKAAVQGESPGTLDTSAESLLQRAECNAELRERYELPSFLRILDVKGPEIHEVKGIDKAQRRVELLGVAQA